MHTGTIVAWRDNLKVLFCEQCGYCHLDPLPTPESIDAYYQEDKFYQTFSPPSWFIKNEHEHIAGLWQPGYAYQANLLRQDGMLPELVDYGCGDGWYVKYWRDQGAPAWGIEPSATARLLAPSTRWIAPDIASLVKDPNCAMQNKNDTDSARMALVLEHVYDPIATLLTVKKAFVGQHGRVQIIVPNEFSSLQRLVEKRHGSAWYVQSPHVNYFTKQSIKALVEACGFRVTYQGGTFPIELAYLLGWKYIGNDEVGQKCHTWRLQFEKRWGSKAWGLYHMLYKVLGWGREALIVGENTGESE